MTICVAICSYGYGHLASQAIESVLSQTRKPDQILLVDDGKHDGITTLGARYNIETIIRVKNMGVVENFNDILFNHVKTDKLLMLGADNYLHPQTLEKLSQQDTDITSYDITLIGNQVDEFRKGLTTEEIDGYHIWRFKAGDINQGNFIHGSSLYDVSKARAVGGYERNPDSVRTEEDYMLWKKMINAGATHSHISKPFLYYRRHNSNAETK